MNGYKTIAAAVNISCDGILAKIRFALEKRGGKWSQLNQYGGHA
jgi:hypothetical protein